MLLSQQMTFRIIPREYLIIACLIAINAQAQKGPQPGDIYREYTVNLKSGDNWRVTDPSAAHPGAAEFLPNPMLSIQIDDLDKAVRAEVLMDIWGGHAGTTGRRFQFNGNEWINVPDIPNIESMRNCYVSEHNVIVDMPLEFLQEGNNSFRGTSGGQVCNNFNWGQWGWYVMMVRIYYSPDKKHSSGHIASPATGDTIMDNPDIEIIPADTGAVSSIQVLGSFYGYDENGDGIYYDWHRAYHGPDITGHLGTITESPYRLSWDTHSIPDQEVGAVSFLARIRDTTGIWYVTDIVDSITLQRPDSLSVRMFTSVGIPQNFTVRNGNTKKCYIRIDTLVNGTAAFLYHRTWNGGDDYASGGTFDKPLLVNGHSYPCDGKNHFFTQSIVQLSTRDLIKGLNQIAYTSDTPEHGIEVLWPGPAIVLRYVSGGQTVSTPTFSYPDGETFQDILYSEINMETEGAQVFYTTDGSDPDPSDQKYNSIRLRVNRTMTVKARAFKKDYYESAVASATYTLDHTSVDNASDEKFFFYPNPASDELTIETEYHDPYSIEITSLNGQLFYSSQLEGTSHQIDLSTFQKGVYFITLRSEDSVTTRKIIKL